MKTVDRYTALLAGLVIAGWLVPKTGAGRDTGAARQTDETPINPSAPAPGGQIVRGGPPGVQPGSSAEGPSQIPPKGWWHVLKRAGIGFVDDRVMTEAAGVTFYALLALFPAIASFISIYGLFADPKSLNDQLQNLVGIVPDGGLDIIRAQVAALTANGQSALGLGAIIGLATSLWSANAGMKSLFDALNVVYHEREKRSYVRFTITAFAFTFGALVFLIGVLVAVVVLPIVLQFIGLSDITQTLLTLTRWPIMLIVLTLALALIYRYGPSRNLARWQWVSWGSAAAALLWLAASLAFSYYVANFGSYNKTYGALGAVVGFMTWIWISSMVVLMGAELNAELEQQTDRDSTVGAEKPQGSRGAYKADVKV